MKASRDAFFKVKAPLSDGAQRPARAVTDRKSSKWLRAIAGAAAVVTLAACSGGGSGGGSKPIGAVPNEPSPPPSPTAEDLANANASQLGVLFKAESKELIITWVDSFATEAAYRVERQIDGATWQPQESLAATASTGAAYTWQRVIDVSATYRVVAERSGYVVPLQSPGGQVHIPVELTAVPPQW